MNVQLSKRTGNVLCGMFLRCRNDATGVVEHPVLEYVPSCQRCADKLSQTLMPVHWQMQS